MKLIDRTMVNLARLPAPDLLGHISLFKKSNGNYYYVYFIEARYFGMKEVDRRTNKIIQEERTNDDYHYSIDTFFNDKSRYLGWSEMFAADFMTEDYEPILTA
jgi:hypothetical protein